MCYGSMDKVMYSNSEFEIEKHLQHFEVVCLISLYLLSMCIKHGWHPINKSFLLHGLTESLI